MTGLLALSLLSVLALCLSLALHICQRARADELRAVIRAQRRCMDQMETELRGTNRKGSSCAGKRDNPRQRQGSG